MSNASRHNRSVSQAHGLSGFFILDVCVLFAVLGTLFFSFLVQVVKHDVIPVQKKFIEPGLLRTRAVLADLMNLVDNPDVAHPLLPIEPRLTDDDPGNFVQKLLLLMTQASVLQQNLEAIASLNGQVISSIVDQQTIFWRERAAELCSDPDTIPRLALEGEEPAVASLKNLAALDRYQQAVWRQYSRDAAALAERQSQFWSERSAELCGESEEVSKPLFEDAQSIGAPLRNLIAVDNYGQEVWRRYVECQEPKVETIPESLLHFKFSRSDAFDMTAEQLRQAEIKICQLVEQNVNLGYRWIVVRGHCDRIGSHSYNYELSQGRAAYVTTLILKHLERTHPSWEPGRDFILISEGRGKSEPALRKPGDSDEDYDRKNRRIELAFRKTRPQDFPIPSDADELPSD